jgi:hypothetical protein
MRFLSIEIWAGNKQMDKCMREAAAEEEEVSSMHIHTMDAEV